MIHIITAFSRFQNMGFYIEKLSDFGIIWHPIFFEGELSIENKNYLEQYSWIEYSTIPKNDIPCDLCYFKLNSFLDKETLIDDDLYFFMNDDDWFDPTIIAKLDSMQDDIIFMSMMRGYKHVSPHPISTLYASPNVGIGTIGLEQYAIRGKILKNERFDIHNGCADGALALILMHKYRIRYESSLYVYFNYLEPGRWTK